MADSAAPPVTLAGVSDNTNDQQAAALGAMAKYGQAGLDAYNQAQQAVQANRQQILNQLSQAQGIGGDAQALLASKVNASTAPSLADLQQGQAALQGDLALGNQQYQKYFGETQAALPVIQAQTQQQAAIRDAALQQAQQQIDAQNAAAAQKAAQDQQMAALQLAKAQADAQAAQVKAQTASAGSNPAAKMTTNGLLGLASSAAQNSVSPAVSTTAAGPLAPGEAAFARNNPSQVLNPVPQANWPGLTQEAANLGDQLGVPANVIAELFSPSQAAALSGSFVRNSANEAKLAPPPPDVSWLTKNVPGVNQQMAQEYVNAPEWTEYQNFTDALMTGAFQLDNNGKITNANNAPAEYVGMTPRLALEHYVTGLPGYAHMKTAALQYYGPQLDQLIKK